MLQGLLGSTYGVYKSLVSEWDDTAASGLALFLLESLICYLYAWKSRSCPSLGSVSIYVQIKALSLPARVFWKDIGEKRVLRECWYKAVEYMLQYWGFSSMKEWLPILCTRVWGMDNYVTVPHTFLQMQLSEWGQLLCTREPLLIKNDRESKVLDGTSSFLNPRR